uniref:Uncharacterized protein n=1 Tax=Spongospora subterranea TaxID=70186 RepID=A0A0H5QKL2_9EUKA|eukprot:CRZ02166.1 hypothetical protein [Spongospora subterranea]
MEMKKQGINLCQYLETMNKDLHVLASGIKPLSTWHRQRVLQTCRECCGGQGLLAANLIGNLMSDTEIDVTWEGDNSVLLQQVSLALLKDYGKLLKAKSAFAIFMEYYGFFRRNSISLSGYRVIDLYVTALAFRQKTLLMEAGSIFRDGAKLPRNPQNKLKVLNKCLPILLGLGIAHMEHEVLVRFKAIVEGGNNPILSKICLLSAVDVVNQNMAFYLEKQYFNSNDAGSMRQLLQELCAELQPNALQLIDAFKIHPNFLDAPIANDWLAANTKDRVPGDSSVKCDHRSKL